MIDLKLGKKNPTTDHKDLLFSTYSKKVKLPTTFPNTFGYGTRFKNWGMLGNDDWGDCVPASRCHINMLDTSVGAPATATYTTKTTLAIYSAVTGFNENDPNTDQGTDMRAMCKYQQKTGLTDAKGVNHKIGAYVSITPGDTLQMLQAIYVFGAFAFGFQVPQSAMDQFNAGAGIWTDVGDKNIIGGHEVSGVGTMNSHGKITLVTWGVRWEMTFGFITTYCDEAWVFVSPEILSKTGKFRGFDLTALSADILSL